VTGGPESRRDDDHPERDVNQPAERVISAAALQETGERGSALLLYGRAE
jgi:hypothetical protein